MPSALSSTVQRELDALGPMVHFLTQSRWSQRAGQPGISDFVLGNPHDGVLPEFTAALGRALPPRQPDWHAYKMSEPEATQVVAASLAARTGIPFEPDDIVMTNGAFAGLSLALRVILEQGDEVIYNSPPWVFYETIVRGTGGHPVRVPVRPEGFDLDLDAIRHAISPRTRAIIVNSPHNPTGKIVPEETLRDLAALLTVASDANARPIFVLSDEAYSRIVFDGRTCPSPATFYDRTFLIYTYGKQLLTPGERLGYLALPPTMPERELIRIGLQVAQIQTGYGFPSALLQHAIADLDRLSIDVRHLQAKRDRVVAGLMAAGYEVTNPEGTFYVLVRSPEQDDQAFAERLAEQDVFVLPGTFYGMPGYLRLSLTATDAMIDRALPIFAASIPTPSTTQHG